MGSTSTTNRIRIAKAVGLPDFETAHALIREMAAWDIAETGALGYPCTDLAATVYSVPAEGLARKFGSPDAGLFIARTDGGEPAGCLAFARFAAGDGEVQKLFVRPEHRGQGIGSMLMAAVLTDMQRLGYAVARLETVSFMTGAIGLYRAFGFAPCEVYRPAPEGLQPITLYMQRSLEASSIKVQRHAPHHDDSVAARAHGIADDGKTGMTEAAVPDATVSRLFDRAAQHASTFRNGLGERPQRPTLTYAEALAAFDEPTPNGGREPEAVLDDLVRRATPGLHASAGPRFFGWVIGASHPVGVAADWLAAAWGQNAGNHTASPAAAACETVAARWLLDILDLPRSASVGFVTGATVANFVALAAARGAVLRRLGWDVEAKGLFGAPPIRVLIGDDAHSTVFSALQYLGLGQERVTRIATDQQGAMRLDAFEPAMAATNGDAAMIVVTQAGQINTGAFDPHPAIVAAARRHPNAWIHVDGAFGLWARAAPSRAHLAAGIEAADSWATDGHKWLQTPYDCGYAIVRDQDAHRRAMTIAASYLPTAAASERDPSHYVPELSRRARGFATWAMLQHLGRDGVAAMVDQHCRLAKAMAARFAEEPGIAVMNDVVLNQAVVRFGADEPADRGDALTLATIAAVQQDGTCFVGGAKWQGRWVMRLSVIGGDTNEGEADRSADAIIETWRKLRG